VFQPEVSSALTQVEREPDADPTKLAGPLTEKQRTAQRQAAKVARKAEDDRCRAEDKDLLRIIAHIILEASKEKRLLVIKKIERIGLGVTITELASTMREIRPELFQWEDASGDDA
jgi:hypothetical protein